MHISRLNDSTVMFLFFVFLVRFSRRCLNATQMAQYFDFPVKIPPTEDVVADVILARWSEVDPMLAVATRNKKLWVVQEEVRGGCGRVWASRPATYRPPSALR